MSDDTGSDEAGSGNAGSDNPDPRRRWLDAAALAAIVAFAWVVARPLLTSEGWPVAHEEFRYIVLVDRFVDAIEQGELYPRYLSDLYGGYGYPVFCFYQPALFYLAAPFF